MATETKKKVKWLPVVSNPDVFNEALNKLNPSDAPLFQYCDVFGLDPDLLSMVPQPVLAVMFLFPLSENYKKAKIAEQTKIEAEGQFVTPKAYFMRQTVGNACGTIGMLHSVLNSRDLFPLADEGGLKRFLEKTINMDENVRADALGDDPALTQAHEEATKHGGEDVPDEKVDTHFICFVHIDGVLYEMDGRKPWPVNHGPTTPDTLLYDAANVIKTKFMNLDPTELRFNIMALAANQGF